MAQFNIYVHGVPIGHEVCPRDAEEDYLKDFYSHDKEIKETSFMQIDVVNGKSFYTYLHKKNVSSEIGRPGSYLGLTVCFSRQYCTNVYMLYKILDTIYQKICIGCLIKQESENERFIVKEIASAQFKGNFAVDYIKSVFKQNYEKYLPDSFEDLDGFSNAVGEVKFSLKEVDSPLFYDTLKNKRILVSPEYGTISVAYNNLLKEMVPLKEEHGRYKQDNERLQKENKNLTEKVAGLENDLSIANTSAKKKYEKQLEDIQKKYNEAKNEKERLEDKIKNAAGAVDLMDEPFNTLTRLLASRFQEESKKSHTKDTVHYPTRRQNNTCKSWLPMVYLVLLILIFFFCCYGCYVVSKLQKTDDIVRDVKKSEEVAKNKDNISSTKDYTWSSSEVKTTEVSPSFDDFNSCKINISHYSGEGNLVKNTMYGLSVVKVKGGTPANVPAGEWVATTDSHLPGININGNSFKVDDKVTQNTNVRICYVVNGEQKLSRIVIVK